MSQTTAADIAGGYYRQQSTTVRQAADSAQLVWRQVKAKDLDGSWQAHAPLLVGAVTEGQQRNASTAQAYINAVIAADNAASKPDGQVRTAAFAGQAADGRPLTSLLYQPVIETRWQLLSGQSEQDAMLSGLDTLLRSVTSEVADAGRGAAGVGIASNRACTGYVRVLNPPSCSRCALLAGKEYAFNTGFQRHPRCDCVHLPTTLYRSSPLTDPKEYFDSLTAAEQNRLFTGAGAQAIRDGADIGQVVNARRAMYTSDAYGTRLASTWDGTTRRGAYFIAERNRAIEKGLIPRGSTGRGYRLKSPRLLPEEIYRLAATRTEAIALLKRYAYLT